jgi:YggT family protein
MIVIYYLLQAYELILIIRVLMSWFRPKQSNVAVIWIYRITEPVLAPIRRMFPLSGLGMDFSPVIAFVLIEIIKTIVFRLLPAVW